MTANGERKNIKNSAYVILSLALAAALLSPLASGSPDGLDWTIEKHASRPPGHAETVARPDASGETEGAGYFIFGDYRAPFITSEPVSTVVSGLAGVALILLFFKFYGRFAAKKRAERPRISGAPRA